MSIYKPKPISGFPEWLPEYRIVEQQWMDKIRAVFESYGFCNIETSSAEEIEVLTAKSGETENEIYAISRLQVDKAVFGLYDFHLKRWKDPVEAKNKAIDELSQLGVNLIGADAAREKAIAAIEEVASIKEDRLALRYDLTVPMARYVAQNFGQLVFPFKRYQMQKVWRGERPQKGRYREFYQCDIDVVGVDDIPMHFDAELPAVLYQAYQVMDIPPVTIHISNRKIVTGYLQGLGINDTGVVTRALDKLDKIRRDGVAKILTEAGLSADLIQKSMAIVEIKSNDAGFADKVRALGVTHPQLTEGLDELTFVMNNLQHLPEGAVVADLGIIRGLDYYTGTVLEVRFREGDMPSIGGGGRYENLAGSFINQKLPGIGVSIGLTRLFGLLMDKGLIKPGAKTPAQILVVLPEEARRAEASATAHTLRAQGYKVEMYHRDAKIKNQLAYAEKKGIPYVWFPPFKDEQPHEVKNMLTGEQSQADPKSWKI